MKYGRLLLIAVTAFGAAVAVRTRLARPSGRDLSAPSTLPAGSAAVLRVTPGTAHRHAASICARHRPSRPSAISDTQAILAITWACPACAKRGLADDDPLRAQPAALARAPAARASFAHQGTTSGPRVLVTKASLRVVAKSRKDYSGVTEPELVDRGWATSAAQLPQNGFRSILDKSGIAPATRRGGCGRSAGGGAQGLGRPASWFGRTAIRSARRRSWGPSRGGDLRPHDRWPPRVT